MAETVIMYSTSWCGYCVRLKRQMKDAGIDFLEVDVDEQRHLGERIVAHTGGYRTVPTLEVGGELLVNPTLAELQERLAG